MTEVEVARKAYSHKVEIDDYDSPMFSQRTVFVSWHPYSMSNYDSQTHIVCADLRVDFKWYLSADENSKLKQYYEWKYTPTKSNTPADPSSPSATSASGMTPDLKSDPKYINITKMQDRLAYKKGTGTGKNSMRGFMLTDKDFDQLSAKFGYFWKLKIVARNSSALIDESKSLGSRRGLWYTYKPWVNEQDGIYPFITLKWHLLGEFQQKMHLPMFPFDCQDLVMSFESSDTSEFVLFQIGESRRNPEKANPDDNIDPADWRLEEFKNLGTWGHVVNIQGYDVLDVTTKVERKYGYYVFVMFLQIFVITNLCYATLEIPPHDIGDRLQVLIVLLLTVVAFKSYVQTLIPFATCATMLDIAISLCVLWMSLFCGESVLAHHDTHEAPLVAIISAIGLAFAIGCVAVVFWYRWKTHSRRRPGQDVNKCFHCKHPQCGNHAEIPKTNITIGKSTKEIIPL